MTSPVPAPSVSVIIPAYNAEAYLAEAVESVRQQACPDLELIIVDDGSTDGTSTVARGLCADEVRYVCQPNGGPAQARNNGLKLARADVIGFVDADDLWAPDRLNRQLKCLRDDASIDVVLGWTRTVRDVPGDSAGSKFEESSRPVVFLSPNAALFRRRVFDQVGNFDESLRFSEDTDWFMRARERGARIVVERDVTLFYRLHASSMTRGKNVKELRLLHVLKRSLDRRRQGAPGEARALPNLFAPTDAANPAKDDADGSP
jgi:glycosyltransferase involved in cell wall biosynthesis